MIFSPENGFSTKYLLYSEVLEKSGERKCVFVISNKVASQTSLIFKAHYLVGGRQEEGACPSEYRRGRFSDSFFRFLSPY